VTIVSAERRAAGRQLRRFVLVLPALGLLVVGLAMPLYEVVKDSLWLPEPSFDAYISVFNDPLVRGALLRTFEIALIVTALSIVGGYVIALTAWRSSPTWSGIILLVVCFPVLTSLVTRNFSWLIFLGRKGPLNDLLINLGVINEPLEILNSRTAVVIGMVHVMLPFAVLPIYNALRRVDPVLLKASAAFGASPMKTFRRIVLPLSAAGGTVATVFVFVLSLGFFITPALLGGPTNSMVSNVIDKEANFYLDFGRASAIAVILLLIVVASLGIVAKRANITKVFRG
jgi:putative spermidine/putrescine transport system permease protein